MIEIYWGEPLTLVVSQDGDEKRFSTIEQVQYWLEDKWPKADVARHRALERVQAAMDCLGSVQDARIAFLNAAKTAGFVASPNVVPALAA